MTSIRKHLIVGLSVLAMGTAAFTAHAQDGRPGATLTKEQKQAKWSERAAARQQKLRETLKLTPSQDAAFASYMAARKPQARAERPSRDDWKTMPAPARMEARLAMAKARTGHMEAQLAALKSFYAVLTPEQQKLFDENSSRRGWGMRHGRGHGRGHGHGHGGHDGHKGNKPVQG